MSGGPRPLSTYLGGRAGEELLTENTSLLPCSPSVLSALVPSTVAAKPVDWEESPLFSTL